MTVDIDFEKVEELAGNGLTIKEIADCIGVARSTIYEHKKKNPDISDAIKRGRSKGLETVTNALFENAKTGNVTAQIFYLKNRKPEKWSDRRDHQHTGKDGGPIEHTARPFSFVDPGPAEET